MYIYKESACGESKFLRAEKLVLKLHKLDKLEKNAKLDKGV
jgi:hypothetical protein